MRAACCTIKPIALGWGAFKNWLSDELHVSHAVLHIHIGMAVYLASSMLLRKRLGSGAPLLVVFVLETANEIADFVRYQVSHWPWGPSGTIEDVVNTLLWPTILTLLFRIIDNRAARFAQPADPVQVS